VSPAPIRPGIRAPRARGISALFASLRLCAPRTRLPATLQPPASLPPRSTLDTLDTLRASAPLRRLANSHFAFCNSQFSIEHRSHTPRNAGFSRQQLRSPGFLHHFCTTRASLFAPRLSRSSLYQPLPTSSPPHGATLNQTTTNTKETPSPPNSGTSPLRKSRPTSPKATPLPAVGFRPLAAPSRHRCGSHFLRPSPFGPSTVGRGLRTASRTLHPPDARHAPRPTHSLDRGPWTVDCGLRTPPPLAPRPPTPDTRPPANATQSSPVKPNQGKNFAENLVTRPGAFPRPANCGLESRNFPVNFVFMT
jgi:hypothetical protein